MKKRIAIAVTAITLLSILIITPIVLGFDTSEADSCGSCHINPKMQSVVNEWYTSGHSAGGYVYGRNDNTYCARCHSPMQADPNATRQDNDPIAEDDWQGVTCSACHLPHDLAGELGTRIGNYDVATGEYIPRYEDVPGDMNAQCQYCHTGSHHTGGGGFMGFGKVMFEKKGVQCVDCHMSVIADTGGLPPEYPEPVPTEVHSHTWRVSENAETACIGCHANKSVEWAEKQIDKGIIHGQKFEDLPADPEGH